jgi:hypothetical protein
MTTPADLAVVDAFIQARGGQRGPGHGDDITYYGPDSQPQGSMLIGLDGSFTGVLGKTADMIPVQLVP